MNDDPITTETQPSPPSESETLMHSVMNYFNGIRFMGVTLTELADRAGVSQAAFWTAGE